MEFRIAPADPRQYERIGDVCAAAYGEDGQFGAATAAYEARLRDVESRGRSGDVLAAVDADGTVLGTVTLCPPDSSLREIAYDGELEFRMLAVDPAAQGRGVGEALVRSCLDYARDNDYHAVVLCTRADAAASARRLYERLGFKPCPERDWQPVPGITLNALAATV